MLELFKAYQTETNPDGTIKIKEIEIFELGKHKGFEYDESWANKALKNHEHLSQGGFFPSAIIGHNDGKQEKPAKGRLSNFKLDGKYIKADIDKVQPETYESLKKGEYPHRSVEVNPDEARFTALALLGGTSPHFKLPNMELFGGDPDAVIIPFQERKTTSIQTIIFEKSKFKEAEKARDWLKEHDFHSTKIDETENSFRFRQKEPGQFEEGSFRTIELASGIKAVIGQLKGQMGEEDEEARGLLQKFDELITKMKSIFENKSLEKPEKEDKDMSVQLSEEQKKKFAEDFKAQYGVTPDEAAERYEKFQEDEKKRLETERENRIKAFAEKLKKESKVAPKLVDERILPFLNALPANGTVKFSEGDEKPTIEAFQEVFESFLEAAKKEELFFDDGEKVTGIEYEQFEDKDKVEKLHAKARKMAQEAVAAGKAKNFNEAYNNAIFALAEGE